MFRCADAVLAPHERASVGRSFSVARPALTPCSTARVVCTAGASVASSPTGTGSPQHARVTKGARRSSSASTIAAESLSATAARATCWSSASVSRSRSRWLLARGPGSARSSLPSRPETYGGRGLGLGADLLVGGRRGACGMGAGTRGGGRKASSSLAGTVQGTPSLGWGDMSRVRRSVACGLPVRWGAAEGPDDRDPRCCSPFGSLSPRALSFASQSQSWVVMLATDAEFDRGMPFVFSSACSPANFAPRSCATVRRLGRASRAASTCSVSFRRSGSSG